MKIKMARINQNEIRQEIRGKIRINVKSGVNQRRSCLTVSDDVIVKCTLLCTTEAQSPPLKATDHSRSLRSAPPGQDGQKIPLKTDSSPKSSSKPANLITSLDHSPLKSSKDNQQPVEQKKPPETEKSTAKRNKTGDPDPNQLPCS